MTKTLALETKASLIGGDHQELRTSVEGGGPGGLELIVSVNDKRAQLAVWNPYRHEWATLQMIGQGDSRKSLISNKPVPDQMIELVDRSVTKQFINVNFGNLVAQEILEKGSGKVLSEVDIHIIQANYDFLVGREGVDRGRDQTNGSGGQHPGKS